MILLLAFGASGLLALGLIYLRVESVAAPRLEYTLDAVPERKVCLVLGCAPTLIDGRPNLYFKFRIDAAAQLYHAGKVQFLLVSGDNSDRYYDEPTAMKKALVAAKVPEHAIICDYAGLRTLDSVVRAKEVFKEESILLVSQPFHSKRAIYLGQALGVDIVAHPAADVTTNQGTKTQMREIFARAKAFLDIHLLDTQAKHLGQPQPIGDAKPGE
ncbi:SanA/YdcF family protein [Rubritalea marina]|uniref:SanA/YdcF family protein n=1 Tax=Rubritalea marina TaxID=361055 RepID=UPI00035F9EA2|nr:ElyC/SanA/YdcF family protein [Rubritalea marina]